MDLQQELDIISISNCRITNLMGEWARQNGLSFASFMILNTIYYAGPCTQKDIADVLLIPKQTVNTVVKDFEKKNYVDLFYGKDQKEKLITFTDEGKVFAKEVLDKFHLMEKRVADTFGHKCVEILAKDITPFANILMEEVESHG